MMGLFLQPDAVEQLGRMDLDPGVRAHAVEVIEKGYTVIREAISPEACREMVDAFRGYERDHPGIFAPNRDARGHYPRIVNLHSAFPELLTLFTRNPRLLATLDALFGARASVYTSLFYEVGSEQTIHRDTPLFATRPEYLYFGTTVYLEAAGDENGCLEVLEGGHLIPELDREQMAIHRYGSLGAVPAVDGAMWDQYQTSVISNATAAGIVAKKLYVEAGDTVIWHPQLPHGGTPISDKTRTRLSLVMHVTPEGVPVYHQHVFFAPTSPFPETPSWSYYTVDEREIADHRAGGISFGHVNGYTVEQVKAAYVPG